MPTVLLSLIVFYLVVLLISCTCLDYYLKSEWEKGLREFRKDETLILPRIKPRKKEYYRWNKRPDGRFRLIRIQYDSGNSSSRSSSGGTVK